MSPDVFQFNIELIRSNLFSVIACREVRVVLSGADKAEAVLSGVIRDKSAYDFPVCGVKSAQWMVDESAAALLIQSNEARKEADKVECLTF